MGWPWLLCLAGQTWNSQRLCRRLGKGFGRTGLPPMRRFQTIAGSHSEEDFVCFWDADSEQIEDMAEELARAREEKDFDLVWADKGAATVSRAGPCAWIRSHTDCKMLWIKWIQSSIFLCRFGIFYTQLKNMLTPWLTNMRYTSFIHVNISTIRIKYWGSEITSLFNASTEHPIINIVHLGIKDFDC